MAKAFKWTAEAQKTLLRFLDTQKESHIVPEKGNKKAINKLKNSIRSQFEVGSPTEPVPTPTEIEQRLKWIWRDRLPCFKSSSFEVFYREGTLALDWDKLRSKPIAKAYR